MNGGDSCSRNCVLCNWREPLNGLRREEWLDCFLVKQETCPTVWKKMSDDRLSVWRKRVRCCSRKCEEVEYLFVTCEYLMPLTRLAVVVSMNRLGIMFKFLCLKRERSWVVCKYLFEITKCTNWVIRINVIIQLFVTPPSSLIEYSFSLWAITLFFSCWQSLLCLFDCQLLFSATSSSVLASLGLLILFPSITDCLVSSSKHDILQSHSPGDKQTWPDSMPEIPSQL